MGRPTKIERLIKEIGQLEEALAAKRGELRAAQERQAEQRFGVRAGSVVISNRSRSKGKKVLVTRVDASSTGQKPWVYGKLEKKDGTFGVRDQVFFGDWSL